MQRRCDMTTLQSDIRILDSLLALNLNISLWSARRKMTPEDLGGAELPPEDLASLGSKRIADPENLRIFGALKARAFAYLDRHGVRFLSGWAIPEEKAGNIVRELTGIRAEFQKAKEDFLADYDRSIQAWIAKHSQWGGIIRDSVVGPDYVRARLDMRWQMYKVAPLMEHADTEAVVESGLADEVTGLGGTLFREIAREADEIWRRVYQGRAEVTHKALSPLRTLHEKLTGLSFVEPHVAPVADIIAAAFKRLPARGNIEGANLIMLQGLVCLLRDKEALVRHAQTLIDGYGPATVLDALLAAPVSASRGQDAPAAEDAPAVSASVYDADADGQMPKLDVDVPPDGNTDNSADDAPVLPEVLPGAPNPAISSMGLW